MHPIAKPSVVSWGAGAHTLLPSVVTWTLPPVAPLYVFTRHLDLCPVPEMTTLGLNEDFWKARLVVCVFMLRNVLPY